LLVGAFLVYNAMTFTVLQRLPQLAVLRGLGVTRGELFQMISREALLVGLLGTAAGLLLGLGLARGLVGLVARTFDDLYFTLTVSGLRRWPHRGSHPDSCSVARWSSPPHGAGRGARLWRAAPCCWCPRCCRRCTKVWRSGSRHCSRCCWAPRCSRHWLCSDLPGHAGAWWRAWRWVGWRRH
jgi:hypothetical protein